MRALVVIGALALALVLQTKLAPFLVLGTSPLDLVPESLRVAASTPASALAFSSPPSGKA